MVNYIINDFFSFVNTKFYSTKMGVVTTDIPLKYYFLFISTPKIFASRRRRAFGELITTIFIVTLLLLSVYDGG